MATASESSRALPQSVLFEKDMSFNSFAEMDSFVKQYENCANIRFAITSAKRLSSSTQNPHTVGKKTFSQRRCTQEDIDKMKYLFVEYSCGYEGSGKYKRYKGCTLCIPPQLDVC